MKKVLFALAFIVASLSAAQAQSGFGIRGGANISNLSGDLRNESRYDNKWGFHAGITYNIPVIGNFFSIQPELLYSQKGFKSEAEISAVGQAVRWEGNMNYDYIDLPVLAKIKAGPLYFEGGPQASYLASLKNNVKTYDANDNEISSTTSEIDRDNMKKFEFGYAAGVGLAFSKVSLGVRYNGSISDFVDDAPDDYFEGDLRNARHSVFLITLGINFGQ